MSLMCHYVAMYKQCMPDLWHENTTPLSSKLNTKVLEWVENDVVLKLQFAISIYARISLNYAKYEFHTIQVAINHPQMRNLCTRKSLFEFTNKEKSLL